MLFPEPGPARPLTVAQFVNTVGNGLFMTVSMIYFTHSVGLPTARVGLGLTLAAGLSLLVAVPVGHLADRIGPREVTLAFMLAEAVLICGYAVVHSFWPFLAVACGVNIADTGAITARQALIAGALTDRGRVAAKAYLRAVTNVGISVGTVLAGVALTVDTRAGYLTMILGDAATFLVAAAVLLRIPHLAGVPAVAGGPRWGALRDRPYVLLALLNAVLAVHFGLLDYAVPLWVVQRTDAPKAVVSVLFLINTVMVVLFQVRVSRGSEDVRRAAALQRSASVLVLGACVLYALAAGQPVWFAVAVLVGGAFVHVLGEMLQSAGQWGLSFGLAPAQAQGQYQGLYTMSFGVARMAGPAVATAVVLWGAAGWLILGAVLVGAGMLVPIAARTALRTRPEPALAG
ncbi:MAG: MFS transporter [Mycobacteriales bacterium]